MAKIARPAQETPEYLGQSLCNCTLIEKINHTFFVVIFSEYRSTAKKITTIYKYYFTVELKIYP